MTKKCDSVIAMIGAVLVLVGGLNWGLVGIFDFNLVYWLFGSVMWLESLVYILVGVSALWLIIRKLAWKKCCYLTGKEPKQSPEMM
jgi:uncharacterized membrane protein YuzA (DUF378 family)